MRRIVILFACISNLVLADAVVKELSAVSLKGRPPVSVIPNLFDLAYVENRGCAWGLLQGRVWPLAIFGAAALLFLMWRRKLIFGEGRMALLTEVFLYAGIIGNLIDRLFRGYVIDMFDCHWGIHHFPCFNVADSLICISVGLLLIVSFFNSRKAGGRGQP